MAYSSKLSIESLQELNKVDLRKVSSAFILIEGEHTGLKEEAARFIAGKVYKDKTGWRDFKRYTARNHTWRVEEIDKILNEVGKVKPVLKHIILLDDLDIIERGVGDKMLKRLEDFKSPTLLIGFVSKSSSLPVTVQSRAYHIFKVSSDESDKLVSKFKDETSEKILEVFSKVKNNEILDMKEKELYQVVKLSAMKRVIESNLDIYVKNSLLAKIEIVMGSEKSNTPIYYTLLGVKEIVTKSSSDSK
jgi:DNA polymerase III delta prime subunit